MIDTDKYEGHTGKLWCRGKFQKHGIIDALDTTEDKEILVGEICTMISPNWADTLLVTDAPLLLEEVKRLQYSYDMAVKQLQNTRLWIAKYEGVLKEMANQASFVKCSALNIDEWIEGVKL